MNKEFEQWNKDYLKEKGFLAPPFTVYKYLQANPHLLKEDGDELNTDFVPPLEIKKTINKKVVINKIFKEKENNHSEDKVMVVSNEASTDNERCGPHHFEIGQFVKLLQWNNYSVSWDALGFGQSWNIAPEDIEPIN
jgi:hypothetical protein